MLFGVVAVVDVVERRAQLLMIGVLQRWKDGFFMEVEVESKGDAGKVVGVFLCVGDWSCGRSFEQESKILL